MKLSLLTTLLALTVTGACIISCKNTPKTEAPLQNGAAVQTEEQVPVAALTFADVAGMYDTEDSEMRVSLLDNGTGTWNMIGSLHWTDFTYIIRGNNIYRDVEEVTADTQPDYVYDSVNKTLKDGDGTLYYLQKED
ncbi:MAG: hypothetical protein IJV37_05120 [Bacteroidales bacterium]|nr:hypothetical protein [Bacteroidales bacterium]